ncbi:hypothetical protein GCM10008927_01990 [Amylibacter ulvae]|uniref:Uncharacterized protein n=1 Tax=Paramylibacter ulvae TaxID=1651968 RepID=A0ABQ3CSU0_9RHOB|nr:hypothetical protein [Amylibacter ulvae]GHA41266.1 hypothetical protein GCM10008927_01990 [Amylibacter ulvae]
MKLDPAIFAKSHDVSAACIFADGLPILDDDALIKSIVAAFPNQRFGQKYGGSATGNDLHFTIGDCFVKIALHNEKLAKNTFQEALNSPFNKSLAVDFETLIDAHKTHALIHVGTGAGVAPVLDDMPDDVLAMLQSIDKTDNSSGKETQDSYGFRLNLLLKVVAFVNHAHEPSLVHWMASQHLLTASGFEIATREKFPIFLFTHPKLFGSNDPETGKQLIGARFMNSEKFIGKNLVFEQSPLGLKPLLELSLMFMQYCRQLGTIPKHGESFGRSAHEVIHVYHQDKTSTDPFGAVHLRVTRHADLPDDYVPVEPTAPDVTESQDMSEMALVTAEVGVNVDGTAKRKITMSDAPKSYPDFDRAEDELRSLFRNIDDGNGTTTQTIDEVSDNDTAKKGGFLSGLFAKKEKPAPEPSKGVMAHVHKFFTLLLLLMAAVLAYLMIPQLLG